MTSFNNIKKGICAFVILFLSACGGTGQDDTQQDEKYSVSGRIVDGLLAQAVVYIDANNDGTRGPNEPRAFTDAQGYFGKNDDVDYCDFAVGSNEREFCLETSVGYGETVIRVDGGYDLSSGEPFIGQLSRRIDLSNPANREDIFLTTFTTLLTNVQKENHEKLLSVLQIAAEDLNRNYVVRIADLNNEDLPNLDLDETNLDELNAHDAHLFVTALTLQKMVSVLSTVIDTRYDELSEQFGTANNSSSLIYDTLAGVMIEIVDTNRNTAIPSLGRVLNELFELERIEVINEDESEEDTGAEEATEIVSGSDEDEEAGDAIRSDQAKSYVIEVLLERVESQIRAFYFQEQLDFVATLEEETIERLVQIGRKIYPIIEWPIEVLRTDISDVACSADVTLSSSEHFLTLSEAISAAKLVEAFTTKINTAGSNLIADRSIDNAIRFLTWRANEEAIRDVAKTLECNPTDSDIAGLSRNDFSDTDSINEDALFGPDSEKFSQVSGTSLRITQPNWGGLELLDLTSNQNRILDSNLIDMEFTFYFQGETNATSGDFVACYKYVDGAELKESAPGIISSFELGGRSVIGEYVRGTWSKFNPDFSGDNNETYSLLMNFEHLGAQYSTMIQPDGVSKALFSQFNGPTLARVGNAVDRFTETHLTCHNEGDGESDYACSAQSNDEGLLDLDNAATLFTEERAQLNSSWTQILSEEVGDESLTNVFVRFLFDGYLGAQPELSEELAELFLREQKQYRFSFLGQLTNVYSVSGLQPYSASEVPMSNAACAGSLPIRNPLVRDGASFTGQSL